MQSPATTDSSPPIIDIITDDLLTDSKVDKLLGVSPASVCRYRLKGRAGVRLPSTWYGRKKVTTRAAIDWWQAEVQRSIRQQPETMRQRRRMLDPALERECEEAGV